MNLVVCSNSKQCNSKHISCGHRLPHDKGKDCDEGCPLVKDVECKPVEKPKEKEG
jgi:hypothetical protein